MAGDDSNCLAKLIGPLQAEQFRIVTVTDREEVVTIARSEVPHLVLLDLKSPFDVCRNLKRSFVTEPIPVIELLFPAEEADRVAILELGADDCIAKPFSFRELTLRIRASLNRTRDKRNKTRYTQSQYYSALARPSARSKARKGN